MATTITAGNSTNGAAISSDNTGILELKTGSGAGTTAITVNASQNVGIGTSSPNQRLQINNPSASSAFASFTNANTGSAGGDGSYCGIDATGNMYVWNQENLPILFGTNNGERARITSGGDFQFNSGYGSVATAYGCRAWVNLNGTGTVAIRASGNVSSITDLGIGSYRVNFSTAMPDANYAVNLNGGDFPTSANTLVQSTSNTTAKCELYTYASGTQVDLPQVFAAVFR